jgi:hypothetical protein
VFLSFNNESWRVALTVVGILVSSPFLKAWIESMLLSRQRLREEYKFAKDYFEDLKSFPEMPHHVRASGLAAIAGTRAIKSELIEYLLGQDDVNALRKYIRCMRILDEDPTSEDRRLIFKKEYEGRVRRWREKANWYVLYVAFVLLAMSPWLYPMILRKSTPDPVGTLCLFFITAVVFFPMAYLSLTLALEVSGAEALVAAQKRYIAKPAIGVHRISKVRERKRNGP